MDVGLFARFWKEVHLAMPDITERRAIHETIRRMIGALIYDLTQTSMARIRDADPRSVDDVRDAGPLIAFSDAMARESGFLKQFLFEHLYRHHQVNRMTSKARRIVRKLFSIFMEEPQLLAPEYRSASHDEYGQARKIADYIAGMTDDFFKTQYDKLKKYDIIK